MTKTEFFADLSGQPDFLEQMLQLRASATDDKQKMVIDFCALIAPMLRQIRQLPASPGYEKLLAENGCDPLIARGLAHIAVRSGRRQARESKRYRTLFDAMRFLAKPGRQARAIVSRAKIIVRAWNETSIVETIFDDAGLNVFEFVHLLEAAVAGQKFNTARVTDIAATIEPHLRLRRGPKVSAPSATHNFILETCAELPKKRRPRAWRVSNREFCDPLTEATRREFDVPAFDSRPVHRRLKARQIQSVG